MRKRRQMEEARSRHLVQDEVWEPREVSTAVTVPEQMSAE